MSHRYFKLKKEFSGIKIKSIFENRCRMNICLYNIWVFRPPIVFVEFSLGSLLEPLMHSKRSHTTNCALADKVRPYPRHKICMCQDDRVIASKNTVTLNCVLFFCGVFDEIFCEVSLAFSKGSLIRFSRLFWAFRWENWCKIIGCYVHCIPRLAFSLTILFSMMG